MSLDNHVSERMHLLMSIQCSSRPSIERDCPSLQEEQGTSSFIGPSPCRKPASAGSNGTWRFERDQKCFDRCVQVCGSPAVQRAAPCHVKLYSELSLLNDTLRRPARYSQTTCEISDMPKVTKKKKEKDADFKVRSKSSSYGRQTH